MDEHLIRGFAVCQTQRTQIITFIQCWTNVEDVGSTLYKCYTNVLRLLGKVSEASEAPPPIRSDTKRDPPDCVKLGHLLSFILAVSSVLFRSYISPVYRPTRVSQKIRNVDPMLI